MSYFVEAEWFLGIHKDKIFSLGWFLIIIYIVFVLP